jgi:hypothetical protein
MFSQLTVLKEFLFGLWKSNRNYVPTYRFKNCQCLFGAFLADASIVFSPAPLVSGISTHELKEDK